MTGATIYKTADGALTTQGIGGTVDLQTVRPLNAERTLTINGSYEQAGNSADNPEFDNTGKRFALSFIEKFADDTVGIAVAYANAESPNNQRKYGVWGYNATDTGFVPAGLDLNNQSTLLDRETLSTVVQWQPNDKLDIVVDVLDIDYSDSGVLRGFIEPFALGASEGSGSTVSGIQVGVNPVLRTDPLQKDGTLEAYGFNLNYAIDDTWSVEVDIAQSESSKRDLRAESYAGLARLAEITPPSGCVPISRGRLSSVSAFSRSILSGAHPLGSEERLGFLFSSVTSPRCT